MKDNHLIKLETLGQSLWLDYIRRDLISDGTLRYLIKDDGLRGMTSNPSIFEKAIAESDIYDQDIREMALKQMEAKSIYETLSQCDVKSAADEFRSLYDKTNGGDGYVSLEVNPHLAYNTQGTVEEARRLWVALDRPNVLIKVPATSDGLPAIKQLISEGINVNATLIFGVHRYRQVVANYISGLKMRIAQGKPVKHIVSVASFFLSRIDTLVDPLVDNFFVSGGQKVEIAKKVHGQVAIASAKAAYQIYKEIFEGDSFVRLAGQGARPQRLLWASTGTKDSSYSDVKYIEQFIGPDTINTAPLETIDAYRDHGESKSTLENAVMEANLVLESLPGLGIDINKITQQLEDEGVKKFIVPFDKLMEVITIKSSEIVMGKL